MRFVRSLLWFLFGMISCVRCKLFILFLFKKLYNARFHFSRMKDRNFDMPYIMLRGKNFFVSYGWSFNNVCQVLFGINLFLHSCQCTLQSLRYNFINTRYDITFRALHELVLSRWQNLNCFVSRLDVRNVI
jgi:hypothetical protein